MTYTLHHADCRDAMREMPPDSVDTIITDPPYGLKFMGKAWDHGVPGIPFWEAALRVAKPGATLLAFGGTRTHHRLMCAIEDAGWELRDCMMWLYGSGFPKSHDVSKAIDKAAGAEREVVRNARSGARGATYAQDEWTKMNWGTVRVSEPNTDAAREWHGWGSGGLKPAWEPIVVAMKPLDGTYAENAQKWGVAGLWIDGGRVETGDNLNGGAYAKTGKARNDGWGMQRAGAGEYKPPAGRWPANVILDEEAAAALDEQSGVLTTGKWSGRRNKPKADIVYNEFVSGDENPRAGSSGGASRFFYCAKASRSERTANGAVECKHPTVKPLALMRYLCRLTKTPTGGVVFDPFAGSGSTLIAALQEGRSAIGCEIDADSCEIARARIDATIEPLFTPN